MTRSDPSPIDTDHVKWVLEGLIEEYGDLNADAITRDKALTLSRVLALIKHVPAQFFGHTLSALSWSGNNIYGDPDSITAVQTALNLVQRYEVGYPALVEEVKILRERVAKQPFQLGSEVVPGLGKTVEEYGEVLQILGKLIANGGKGKHWDGQGDLFDRLSEEFADAQAATDFMILHNHLDNDKINARTIAKLDQYEAWKKGGT